VAVSDLRAALDPFAHADEIIWVQEEPENMGAWDFIRPYLYDLADGRRVRRVARPRSASPAEGSAAFHSVNQRVLIEQAYGVRGAERTPPPAAEPIMSDQLTSVD
jgi:2-oxoglutarate dehydrogenase E1 component